MRMIRWIWGYILNEKIRNEVIRNKVGVVSVRIKDKMREVILKWFGYVINKFSNALVGVRLLFWGSKRRER